VPGGGEGRHRSRRSRSRRRCGRSRGSCRGWRCPARAPARSRRSARRGCDGRRPPTTSQSTLVSFIPVSSNSFSSRWISRPRSAPNSVRLRVRSRSSRIPRGGTNEANTMPDAPARARNATSDMASSTTISTRRSTSQANNRRISPGVASSRSVSSDQAAHPGLGTRTHATTNRLPTSTPAARGTGPHRCFVVVPQPPRITTDHDGPLGGIKENEDTDTRALTAAPAQTVVPEQIPIANSAIRALTASQSHQLAERPTPIFLPPWSPRSGLELLT